MREACGVAVVDIAASVYRSGRIPDGRRGTVDVRRAPCEENSGILRAMPEPLVAAAILVASYLLGSLPFGLWLALGVAGIDPRRRGSGNVGATNVARLLGKRFFPVVFLLDAAKGAIPPALVHVSQLPDPHWAPMLKAASAGAAVAGHVFSVFLRFRGGKGVATTAGALVALAPLPLAGSIVVFAATLAVTRYISLASVLAAVAMPLFTWWYDAATETLWFTGTVAVVILVRHHTNLFRILQGAEPQLGRPRPAAAPEGGTRE